MQVTVTSAPVSGVWPGEGPAAAGKAPGFPGVPGRRQRPLWVTFPVSAPCLAPPGRSVCRRLDPTPDVSAVVPPGRAGQGDKEGLSRRCRLGGTSVPHSRLPRRGTGRAWRAVAQTAGPSPRSPSVSLTVAGKPAAWKKDHVCLVTLRWPLGCEHRLSLSFHWLGENENAGLGGGRTSVSLVVQLIGNCARLPPPVSTN